MRRKLIQGIYKITNETTGKFYIGSSNDIKDRWREHTCCLRRNKHHSQHLQRSWNKYGEENFEFEIIELVESNKELLPKEQGWMDKTQCYNRDIGYNVSKSATGVSLSGKLNGFYGKKHSSETRKHMSINHADAKGNKNPNYGKIHSKETKTKISEAIQVKIKNGWERSLKGKKRGADIVALYTGENSCSKLTKETARKIKMALACDMDVTDISELFGVLISTVKGIKAIAGWMYELEEWNVYIKHRGTINKDIIHKEALIYYNDNFNNTTKKDVCRLYHLSGRSLNKLISQVS